MQKNRRQNGGAALATCAQKSSRDVKSAARRNLIHSDEALRAFQALFALCSSDARARVIAQRLRAQGIPLPAAPDFSILSCAALSGRRVGREPICTKTNWQKSRTDILL